MVVVWRFPRCHCGIPNSCLFCLGPYRINKKGSQKDAEQKKNGNYFFYDDGADDDDDDIDDDDL